MSAGTILTLCERSHINHCKYVRCHYVKCHMSLCPMSLCHYCVKYQMYVALDLLSSSSMYEILGLALAQLSGLCCKLSRIQILRLRMKLGRDMLSLRSLPISFHTFIPLQRKLVLVVNRRAGGVNTVLSSCMLYLLARFSVKREGTKWYISNCRIICNIYGSPSAGWGKGPIFV